MKRASTLHLTLLASMAAVLTGCNSRTTRYCVDASQSVADDQDCERQRAGRHWYYTHGYSGVRNGTRLQGGSTIPPAGGFQSRSSGAGVGSSEGAGSERGGIGAAGEAAGAHGASGHGGGGE